MEEVTCQNQEPTQNSNKILIIGIIAILILITAIILIFIFLLKPWQPETNETQQTNKINETNETSSIIMEKVQECAIENPNQICTNLYTTPDIETKCLKLNEERNQCLYNFAIINERLDTCNKITNLDLKTKCQEEINEVFVSE